MDPMQNIQSLLSCGVCFEKYDENETKPMITYCGHNFCEQCLKMIKICPTCRVEVKGYIPNLSLNGIKENLKMMKKSAIENKNNAQIQQSAQPYSQNKDGPIPLVEAVKEGDVIRVKELLKNGAKVDEENEKNNRAIFWAIGSGHKEIVKILLEAEASVNTPNKDGDSPLNLACCDGNFEIVDLLLDFFADINFKDPNGYSPLAWAAKEGHFKIMQLLLANGAEVDIRDNGGNTPLYLTTNGQAVEVLLKKGASSNIHNNNGYTPLICACDNGDYEKVNLLLNNKADVNLKNSYNGSSPLGWAAAKGHVGIIKLLLAVKGVIVDTKNGDDDTPLSLAAGYNHYEAVQLLLEHGALPKLSTKDIGLIKDSRILELIKNYQTRDAQKNENSNVSIPKITTINSSMLNRNFNFKLDPEKLKEIFRGKNPGFSIQYYAKKPLLEDNNLIMLTGHFIEITGVNGDRYAICPSQVTKEINGNVITSDGYFYGNLDEIGLKLANLFFANLQHGAKIHLNSAECYVHKINNKIYFLPQKEFNSNIQQEKLKIISKELQKGDGNVLQLEAKIKEIFGNDVQISCVNNIIRNNCVNVGKITGDMIYEIESKSGFYRFSLSKIIQTIGDLYSVRPEMLKYLPIRKADGYFEGPWNDKGIQLAQFLFGKGYENKTLIINQTQWVPGENYDISSLYF